MSKLLHFNLFLLILCYLFIGLECRDYDESRSRKALILASAAHSSTPATCIQNRFSGVQFVERYEPICDSSNVNTCSGYLAIDNTEKVIILAFRGATTDSQKDFIDISGTLQKPDFAGMGGVNLYFFNAFFSIWNNGMGKKFHELVNNNPGYGLWTTGHSLGAAISSLAAAQIHKDYKQFNKYNADHYNFGEPRVGDQTFAAAHSSLLPDFYRVTHWRDLVPLTPKAALGYVHHKNEVWYNNTMASDDAGVICTPENDNDYCGPEDRTLINDHIYYFGVLVNQYGIDGCKTPIQ